MLSYLLFVYCVYIHLGASPAGGWIGHLRPHDRECQRHQYSHYMMMMMMMIIIIIIIIISSSSSSSTQRSARGAVDKMHVFQKKRCSRLGQKQLVMSTSMQQHIF